MGAGKLCSNQCPLLLIIILHLCSEKADYPLGHARLEKLSAMRIGRLAKTANDKGKYAIIAFV